ncbi:MAG: wax ester/triacylglycerol synthase family O-acyltransferase [Burkholderiaceae bacterium]
MNHLSGMDASFLHLETPETPMHVGGMHTLELPAGYSGDFYEDFRQHIIDRLHVSDVFTRKLALMPFEMSNPVWVQDDDVDIDYHIRRVTLPKPGTHKQLEQYVARLHSSLLDRSRPLWEFFVIDGLENGRVALYTKVHHAGIDGQSGVALATAIMDTTPEPRKMRPPREPRRAHQYQLGMAELASAAVSNMLQQYIKVVKTLPDMARALQSVVLPAPDADGKRDFKVAKDFKLFGPKTMFNVSITNQRAYAGRSISLAETKQIGKRLGYSLNDVVLATCGGALRRYLGEYNALPKKSLTAAVPVSLREQGNTDANNQVSMTMMTLATDIKDPIERLKVINESSAAAKTMMGNFKTAIPTDFPAFGAPWLMSGLASMYGRSGLANSLPPVANVAVSNVPGAQMPLYVCGARMLSYFPVSIPTHGVALNITVQSYNGSLDYGLIACRRAVPDVADLADFVVEEHRRLFDAAMNEPSVAVAAVPAVSHAPPPRVVEPTVPRKRTVVKKAITRAPAKKSAAPIKTAAKRASEKKSVAKKAVAKKPAARKPRTTMNALH